VGTAFAGFEIESTSGTTAFVNIEAQYETSGSFKASGKAGFRVRF